MWSILKQKQSLTYRLLYDKMELDKIMNNEQNEQARIAATHDNDLWEHRRYELAKAALIGLSGKAMPIEVAAVEAVVYADAVIKELRHET
jgi:hypothetical protein